jgi:lysophospholipase L1-like esterase
VTGRRSRSLAVCGLLLVLLTACSSSHRTTRPRAAGSTPATTAGSASATAPGGPAVAETYVALGDSFTAAPLAGGQGTPAGCLRSVRDYPSLVATALGAHVSLINVSCYGATTADLSHAQHTAGQSNPAQLSALSTADRVVTVQLGGDDIGFGRIAGTCGALSLTSPDGDPCQQHYTKGGPDQLAEAVTQAAPQVAAALAAIRARAPSARVLVVGYPDILPVSGNGCWPEVTIARGDLPYLRGVETKLNAMLAAAAAHAHDTFVDTYTPSIGHDACRHGGTKWVEGLIPTSAAVPMHPNALGEQAMAREIEAALR